jgi:hypothetical protein
MFLTDQKKFNLFSFSTNNWIQISLFFFELQYYQLYNYNFQWTLYFPKLINNSKILRNFIIHFKI